MTTQWYLYKNGKQSGPLSWEQLVEQEKTGGIGPADMVWTEGMENWTRAGQVKGLVSAPPTAPPGPPSAPQAGPAPSHQQRAARNYRAAPAPRRGKGMLIALIVLLAVIFLGGGYFAASYLFLDSNGGVIADRSDEIITTDSGQGSGVSAHNGADTSDLWAPPVVYDQTLIAFLMDGDRTLADIQSQYNEFVAGMPNKGDVPIPPYPDSYVCNYISGGGMLNDAEILFSSVVLLTADPVESVLAFYKDKLQGYSHREIPMVEDEHVLWQGDADDYQDAVSGFIPSILIHSSLEYELYMMMMPEAQTLITLVYQPSD